MKTPGPNALAALLNLPAAEFVLEPETMLCLLGALQLALRHPEFEDGFTARRVRQFALILESVISTAHPEIAALCRAGWNP